MPVALNVDIFEDDGSVKVRHVFFGEDEDEAQEAMEDHMESCHALRTAEEEGRTGMFTEPIDDDELPSEADYEPESESEA